jgi:hypothetical protein
LRRGHGPEADFEGITVRVRTGGVALVREGAPLRKGVPEAADPNATSGSAALEAAVAADVKQVRDEVAAAGHRRVVCTGDHAPREVTSTPRDTPITRS